MASFDLNHSHPLINEISQLQAVLVAENKRVHCVRSSFKLIAEDIVNMVFDAYEQGLDAGERARVQGNLVRYAQCSINNIKEGI